MVKEAPELQFTGSSVEDIANHLLEVERTNSVTRALATGYPDMTRERAYDIQLLALEKERERGRQLVGWKMGGTRVVDPSGSADPSFAYMLDTDNLVLGQTLDPGVYVGDSVLVEAEVAFVIGKDIHQPVKSREELYDAVESVRGAVEIISTRVLPGIAGEAATMNHMVAARLSHAGVLLSDEQFDIATFDAANEQAVALIEGEEEAAGRSNQIMNSSPVEALEWLANTLPEHGMYLRAGDIVITGSLYANPTLKAGQRAVVRFSSLGSLSVTLGN